jgi:anti-anti-sigma regulatory factor
LNNRAGCGSQRAKEEIMGERFELPAELNIYSALETRDALLTWVAEQGAKGRDHLDISARDVVEVDGSGLQLLAALSHGETPWYLVEASAPFAEACRTLGLGNWLNGRSLTSTAGGAAP